MKDVLQGHAVGGLVIFIQVMRISTLRNGLLADGGSVVPDRRELVPTRGGGVSWRLQETQ